MGLLFPSLSKHLTTEKPVFVRIYKIGIRPQKDRFYFLVSMRYAKIANNRIRSLGSQRAPILNKVFIHDARFALSW